MPGAVERRRDPPDHGLRVRLVHRRRHGADPEAERARWGGGGGVGVGREEGAEQDELPAEGRGGGPHAAAVLQLAHRFAIPVGSSLEAL